MGNVDGTGNDGAEIDIFESAWTADYTKSVIHIDGYGTSTAANTVQYNTMGIHNGSYHIWGMWWTSSFIKIYYDGVLKVTYNVAKWIPQVDEYLWLSDSARFGFTDGDPCFTSQPLGFLTEAYVDYIRVWKPQVNSSIDVPNSSCIAIKSIKNKLQVDAQSLIVSISVYDTLGRMLAQHFPENTSATIDMNDSGVYLVETKLENGDLKREKFFSK